MKKTADDAKLMRTNGRVSGHTTLGKAVFSLSLTVKREDWERGGKIYRLAAKTNLPRTPLMTHMTTTKQRDKWQRL